VRGNTLLNNTFALFVEAAFPVQNTALKGDVHHRLENNVIAQSCEADLLLSFTRHTAALGLNVRPYLRNSVYELDLGGNLPWAVSGTPTQEALVTRWSLIAR